MEITCQQCGTVFSVDPDSVSGDSKEVVCPGCFQFHVLPTSSSRPVPRVEEPDEESKVSPLGDGGVVDRLRDGFTLFFEVRHPAWPSSRKLNPFEIRQRIYQREFDGEEEFREKAGRWFSIGEHPDFAKVFQIIGRPLAIKTNEPADPSQRKFTGWKGSTKHHPPASAPAPESAPEPEPEDKQPLNRWPLLLAIGVTIIAIIALLAMLQ